MSLDVMADRLSNLSFVIFISAHGIAEKSQSGGRFLHSQEHGIGTHAHGKAPMEGLLQNTQGGAEHRGRYPPNSDRVGDVLLSDLITFA